MSETVPKYVLSLTATHITVPGPQGDQYYSVTVAADKLADFNKPLPKKDRGDGSTELERVFRFFQEAVEKLEATKEGIDQA